MKKVFKLFILFAFIIGVIGCNCSMPDNTYNLDKGIIVQKYMHVGRFHNTYRFYVYHNNDVFDCEVDEQIFNKYNTEDTVSIVICNSKYRDYEIKNVVSIY